MTQDLAAWLSKCPLVAILRGVKPTEVVAIGQVLIDSGFAIIEVPLNSPAPLDSIARLSDAFGDRALIGAGTLPVLPVGGITPSAMAAWWLSGASGFGLGSALYKPGDSADTVRGKARSFQVALAAGQGTAFA